jgi:hypothetical protein
MLEGRVAAKFPEVAVGAHEDLLGDVVDLVIIARVTRGRGEDPLFVPANQFGKSIVPAGPSLGNETGVVGDDCIRHRHRAIRPEYAGGRDPGESQ